MIPRFIAFLLEIKSLNILESKNRIKIKIWKFLGMKIIVRYCQQWANFTTKMIEILDDDTLVSLKKKVAEKFHLKTPRFFLKINKDGFNVFFI